MRCVTAFAIVMVAGGGCAGEHGATQEGCDEPPLPVLPVPDVCNGDEGFRLWGAQGGGAMDVTTPFLQPWGYSGLYVNGLCQWFAVHVDPTTGTYTPVRTGEFTPEQIAQLADELSLGQWGRMATPQVSGPLFDFPTVILQFAGDQFTRIGDLGGLDPVWEQMSDEADTLWPTGQDAVGENQDVRVLVWPAADGPWYPPTWDAGPWSGPSLAALALPLFDNSGVRVYPEDDAEAFRALRERFIAEALPVAGWDIPVPVVQEDDELWYVLVREELDMPQLFGAVAP